MADSAQGSAATAGDRDEVTQESSRESISDLRKSVLAEAATQMRPTIAQPTQDLIDAIEDEEYNWSAIQLASIDIPRIVHHILEKDSGVRAFGFLDTAIELEPPLFYAGDGGPCW